VPQAPTQEGGKGQVSASKEGKKKGDRDAPGKCVGKKKPAWPCSAGGGRGKKKGKEVFRTSSACRGKSEEIVGTKKGRGTLKELKVIKKRRTRGLSFHVKGKKKKREKSRFGRVAGAGRKKGRRQKYQGDVQPLFNLFWRG